MEFHELLIVLDDRAGNFLGEALGERAAQVIARLLDAFVAREFFWHGSVLNSSFCKYVAA